MDLTASKLLTVFNFPTDALKNFQVHFLKYCIIVISRVRIRIFSLFNGHLELVAIVLHLYTHCPSV
jgi:hypothetical protein